MSATAGATTPAGTEAFTYDADGNRLSRKRNGVPETLTYGATTNRLLSSSGGVTRAYTYDANGSPTSDGTNTFAYDARGRLVGASSGPLSAQYYVSASGQRVAKSVTR